MMKFAEQIVKENLSRYIETTEWLNVYVNVNVNIDVITFIFRLNQYLILLWKSRAGDARTLVGAFDFVMHPQVWYVNVCSMESWTFHHTVTPWKVTFSFAPEWRVCNLSNYFKAFQCDIIKWNFFFWPHLYISEVCWTNTNNQFITHPALNVTISMTNTQRIHENRII